MRAVCRFQQYSEGTWANVDPDQDGLNYELTLEIKANGAGEGGAAIEAFDKGDTSWQDQRKAAGQFYQDVTENSYANETWYEAWWTAVVGGKTIKEYRPIYFEKRLSPPPPPAGFDPFGAVYAAIWAALLNEVEVTGRVPANARLRYDTDTLPVFPRKIAVADTPELEVVPTGATEDLVYTSTNCRIDQDYDIRVTCADTRLRKQLTPLKWGIMKALYKASPTLGLDYVVLVSVADAVEMAEGDPTRGTPRWTLAVTVSVTMMIARSQLAS